MDKSELVEAAKDANVQAFLRAIRLGEGTSDEDGYYRLVGSSMGRQLQDLSDHPRILVYLERYKVNSTAAGAYQFLRRTWDALAVEYGLEDFSEENQDLGAIALIAERGALSNVIKGEIELAVAKVRNIWASLPGAGYGQREEKLEIVLNEFTANGGTLA